MTKSSDKEIEKTMQNIEEIRENLSDIIHHHYSTEVRYTGISIQDMYDNIKKPHRNYQLCDEVKNRLEMYLDRKTEFSQRMDRGDQLKWIKEYIEYLDKIINKLHDHLYGPINDSFSDDEVPMSLSENLEYITNSTLDDQKY